MNFKDLNIIDPILKAIESQGYKNPSPIQEQAIPVLLAGKDVLGSAQTGTGKTAAFAIPIIQGLTANRDHNPKRVIKALIMAPTRELAEQIKESFRTYGKNLAIKADAIYGGVSQRTQEVFLSRGIDVLIATPGRLWDLIQQRKVNLGNVKYLVLDEADGMLDMGFIEVVNKIVAKIPESRQTMLFSATIPNEILKLANALLTDPVRIALNPEKSTAEKVEQTVYFIDRKNKTSLLIDLLVDKKIKNALVFTRTKHGADKLEKELLLAGFRVGAIHGNKSQAKRNRVLADFKSGRIQALIATDVAARGIDISKLSHVVNYELPETAEAYIHRMGRTGRAGLSGEAFSFSTQDEVYLLRMIEKHIKQSIKPNLDHKYAISITNNGLRNPYKPNRGGGRSQGGSFGDRPRGPRRFDDKRPRDYSRSDRKPYDNSKPRVEGYKDRPRSSDVKTATDKPFVAREPRREGYRDFKGGSNSAPTRNFADKAPRTEGYAGKSFSGSRPTRSYNDKAPRSEGYAGKSFSGSRPTRSYNDKAPRTEGYRDFKNKNSESSGGERSFKPRSEGYAGKGPGGSRPTRSFGDKPVRRDGDAPRSEGYNKFKKPYPSKTEGSKFGGYKGKDRSDSRGKPSRDGNKFYGNKAKSSNY
jgi:ATP-dependent RNA helicase RhlE